MVRDGLGTGKTKISKIGLLPPKSSRKRAKADRQEHGKGTETSGWHKERHQCRTRASWSEKGEHSAPRASSVLSVR